MIPIKRKMPPAIFQHQPASAANRAIESRKRNRRGGIGSLLAIGLVIATLLGVAGAYVYKNRSTGESIQPIMTEVTRGEFVSQVLDQGEIQSSENVEIRCEAKSRNGELMVLKAVPEGTRVEEGDFLIQLDATSFEKELEVQKIAMASAETAKIQAEATLDTAKASLKEYIQGTYVENEKTIENEIYDADSLIKTAQQELSQAEAVYEHNKKLYAKSYITFQALEATEFAVKKAQIGVKKGENSLELANKKLEVLKEITSAKFIVQFESDIKAAQVNKASQEEAYLVEEEKLREIKKMMQRCEIRVPKGVSGQVVYAQERSRGQDWVFEEGTAVRENQVLIRLPNPSKMEVKALINEQSITQVEINMPVRIKVDALNNTTLKGVVTKVNQYAEQGGWMASSVRKYAVFVRIINPPETLKPGMNASVSIQTQFVPDALVAPIQTVYGVANKQFCLAKVGDQWKTLEVDTGGDNSQMVLFKSGVEKGTKLVMNPAAYKEYMDLPEVKSDSRIELPQEGLDSVGKTSAEMGQNKSGDKPPGGNAEGRPGRPGGGMSLPASGSEMIKSKDTDNDGKLSKAEAGSEFEAFFDRIDTDSDGFVSLDEADAMVARMKLRRPGGGGPGGGGGNP